MISAAELYILLNCTTPAKRTEHIDALGNLLRDGYLTATNDGDAIAALAPTTSGLSLLAGITLPAIKE
jgi:hypothetical protein